MADERNDEDFGKTEQHNGQQQPTDQQGQQPDEQQPTTSGQTGSQDEGFIGSQGPDSDEKVEQDPASSATATEGSDFASQGQGATDKEHDDKPASGSTGDGSSGGGSDGNSSGGGSF